MFVSLISYAQIISQIRATWFCNLSSRSRYLILQLIIFNQKTFVDVCATKKFEDCENCCFDFFSFLEGKQPDLLLQYFLQKGKNIFLTFLEKWLRNAKTLEWGCKVVRLKWQTPISDRQTMGERQTISDLKNRLVTFNTITLVT